MHGVIGLLARQALEHAADHRHAACAADQQNAVDGVPSHARRGDDFARRERGALEQWLGKLVELFDGDRNIFHLAGMSHRHGRLASYRERALGLFDRDKELAQRDLVLSRVGGRFGTKSIRHPVDERLIPIAATEAHVAVGRQRCDVAWRKLDDRNVERAAAEIVNEHGKCFARLARR